MAVFQRVALFLLFDSLERDLIQHIRNFAPDEIILSDAEREKASVRINPIVTDLDADNEFDVLYGLDLGDKFSVLLRHKNWMSTEQKDYFTQIALEAKNIISVRNDIMHGRPLTITQQLTATNFAEKLLKSKSYWPRLHRDYLEYTKNPSSLLDRSVSFLMDGPTTSVLHNLPVPDHDATGFLPRPGLQKDLKKKILGRSPVVTVLGEGGNGKTALALQVVWDLINTADHDFDAVIWTTAKAADLATAGIKELSSEAVSALKMIEDATVAEPDAGDPQRTLDRFLSDNKVLWIVDNYETITGEEIKTLADEVPGESKILFTSRLPIGSGATVGVDELSERDALVFYRRLVDVLSVKDLQKRSEETVSRWLTSLSNKPLLIKWLVLGVKSGLNPDTIVENKDIALRFCLDNVILELGREAQAVIVVLATVNSSLSPSVIREVSGLDAMQVTDGLAELNRYGLLKQEVSNTGCQEFSIKQFSRAYIHRLIKPKSDIVDEITRRYQGIISRFQAEQRSKSPFKYSAKHFEVRSHGEMVTANLLSQALRLAQIEDFDGAEHKLSEAKVLEPQYFEVYRVEAVIAYRQNDWPRAVEANRSAIAIDASQPQLHANLALLHLRLLENDLAAEHFKKALTLDRNSLVIREFARNEYMRLNFDESLCLAEEALKLSMGDPAEVIKCNDVLIQYYVRRVEYLAAEEDLKSAVQAVQEFCVFYENLDFRLCDDRLHFHASKIGRSLAHLERLGCDDSFLARARLLVATEGTGEVAPLLDLEVPTKHTGRLKSEGRKPDFGFIESETAPDCFVHVTRVSPDIWEAMLNGSIVLFDWDTDDLGRNFATNISLD